MEPRPPLAERMRPRSLEEVVGQDHLTGEGGSLRVSPDRPLPSTLLWGPPGSGKTTLARLLARETGALFLQISAVLAGLKELRGAVERARTARDLERRATLLFVDEVHRWNKAQQDALLPHVESGRLTLVGATTENPSFQVIAPLRSRCRILRLNPLSPEQIRALLHRALTDEERGLGGAPQPRFEDDALQALARLADGDARRALGMLEELAGRLPAGETVDRAVLGRVLQRKDIRHDRDGDVHYDVLSAFIKSMRGSDPDAALYWLARLLAGGEPPEAVARRIVIFAAEDVGNADPRALTVAVSASRGVEMVGMPEARLLLAQAVTFCASAPKSNASYVGLQRAEERVRSTGALPVPLHLRNAPTDLARELGHGEGYRYPHDHPGNVVDQEYRPQELCGEVYYEPVDHGAEKTIGERLRFWRKRLARRRDES